MRRTVPLIVATGLLGFATVTQAGSYSEHFTGFYVGGNIGGLQLFGPTNASAEASDIHVIDFNVNEIQVLGNAQNSSLQKYSFVGVLNLGYGYQFCSYNFYLGAEGYVSFANRNDKVSNLSTLVDINPVQFSSPFDVVALATTTKTSLENVEWGIDVKPGFTFETNTLIYGRVGAAFNRLTIRNDNTLSVTYPNAGVASPTVSILNTSHDKNVTGLRLGLGIEQYLCNCLSASVDYIYTNFGSVSTNGIGTVNSQTDVGAVAAAGAFTSHAKTTLHSQEIIFGIKYYFTI